MGKTSIKPKDTKSVKIGFVVAIFYCDLDRFECGMRFTKSGSTSSIHELYFCEDNLCIAGIRPKKAPPGVSSMVHSGTLLEVWYREKANGPIYCHRFKQENDLIIEAVCGLPCWAAYFKQKVTYTKKEGIR